MDIAKIPGGRSYRRIAVRLRVAKGTIRGRIKRLEKERCIRLTAVTNPMYTGSPKVLAIGLFPTLEGVVDLANNRILALPGVRPVDGSIAANMLEYDCRVAKITSSWNVAT